MQHKIENKEINKIIDNINIETLSFYDNKNNISKNNNTKLFNKNNNEIKIKLDFSNIKFEINKKKEQNKIDTIIIKNIDKFKLYKLQTPIERNELIEILKIIINNIKIFKENRLKKYILKYSLKIEKEEIIDNIEKELEKECYKNKEIITIIINSLEEIYVFLRKNKKVIKLF